jgi:hypothetical protein
MLDMPGPGPFWKKNFDFLAQQLFSLVTKQSFSLMIDQNYFATLVRYDDRIRRRLQ